jgi:hypothetical protein
MANSDKLLHSNRTRHEGAVFHDVARLGRPLDALRRIDGRHELLAWRAATAPDRRWVESARSMRLTPAKPPICLSFKFQSCIYLFSYSRNTIARSLLCLSVSVNYHDLHACYCQWYTFTVQVSTKWLLPNADTYELWKYLSLMIFESTLWSILLLNWWYGLKALKYILFYFEKSCCEVAMWCHVLVFFFCHFVIVDLELILILSNSPYLSSLIDIMLLFGKAFNSHGSIVTWLELSFSYMNVYRSYLTMRH